MMHSAEIESACFSLHYLHKSHTPKAYHVPKRSRMNSSPTSFALIWNLDKNPIKGGHPWVITGSLANHKGESLQAPAMAKKRSAASDENRTQTRAHCVCYLLLHNEPSHSLVRVSGVQPLSPRPAFDPRVEMQLKRPRWGCGDRNTHPRVLLLSSSLRRSYENNADTQTHSYTRHTHTPKRTRTSRISDEERSSLKHVTQPPLLMAYTQADREFKYVSSYTVMCSWQQCLLFEWGWRGDGEDQEGRKIGFPPCLQLESRLDWKLLKSKVKWQSSKWRNICSRPRTCWGWQSFHIFTHIKTLGLR